MVFARNLRLETKVIEFSQTNTLMYNIFFCAWYTIIKRISQSLIIIIIMIKIKRIFHRSTDKYVTIIIAWKLLLACYSTINYFLRCILCGLVEWLREVLCK